MGRKLAIEALEPFTSSAERFKSLSTMAELFKTLGYTQIKARLIHYPTPGFFTGTLQNHRPDLTCRQNDRKGTPLILDVVGPFEVTATQSHARWSLLNSAARLYDAELHFAVPSWSPGGSVEDKLRARLKTMDIQPKKVWTL